VHVQGRAIVQHNELMLSTAIDASNATAGETTQAGLAEKTSNIWMKNSRAPNALA
jgi:hypothetical protein